jgi:translation elongation factor P/translation initiation factor 5A
MITPNEFKSGVLIKFKDGIYQVLSYSRSRTAQRRARVVAKLRNIKSGVQIEESFESEASSTKSRWSAGRRSFTTMTTSAITSWTIPATSNSR